MFGDCITIVTVAPVGYIWVLVYGVVCVCVIFLHAHVLPIIIQLASPEGSLFVCEILQSLA